MPMYLNFIEQFATLVAINENKPDDLLSLYLFERKKRLIEYLMKSHPDETGYSIPSINRKPANMRKTVLIFTEKDPEVLAQYGIEKEAGNASYIISKNAFLIMIQVSFKKATNLYLRKCTLQL
jgi:hypothetical protein